MNGLDWGVVACCAVCSVGCWAIGTAAGCVLMGVWRSFGPMRVLDEWMLSLGVRQVTQADAASGWVEIVLEGVVVVLLWVVNWRLDSRGRELRSVVAGAGLRGS